MNKPRMAACGLDCSECGAYKVTMFDDLEEAGKMVEFWRYNGWIGPDDGAEAILKMNPVCKGCWDNADCCIKCGCGENRDFRACCNEKQIRHCGECGVFPCEDYKAWASQNEGCRSGMNVLLSLRGECRTYGVFSN